MKRIIFFLFTFIVALSVIRCSQDKSNGSKQETDSNDKADLVQDNSMESDSVLEIQDSYPEIPSIDLSSAVNNEMALIGKGIFETKCTMCHMIDKPYIGPPAKGVIERREADWIMRMIMYPDLMQKQDSIAKNLISEYNGAVMPNQAISFDEARSIVEFYRTLQN
jgi:cytochrome c